MRINEHFAQGHRRRRQKVGNVSFGSWLRDNVLAQSATVYDPVNVVRHGRFAPFFPVGRSGPFLSDSGGMLGKVLLAIGT